VASVTLTKQPQNVDGAGQADVELTPKIIEAGGDALARHVGRINSGMCDLNEIAARIFVEMATAAGLAVRGPGERRA
jgi:hypothetical protein